MPDYIERVIAFRSSISIFLEMLEKGVISKEDYKEIAEIMIEKYHLSDSTIFEDIT